VQVSAELDLNQLSKTSETFDPNGQVVRSTQTRDLANTAKGGDSGQVSVSTELPGATPNAGTGSTTSEEASTTEETTNYEISKTTQTELTQAGGIKRLSIAVVVDGTYVSDATGNSTYTPRTPAEIEQITSLVKSAIGFDEARGDQVQVANLQFADRPELTAGGTTEAGLFDFTRDDLMNGAEMAVTLLIALALVFFVLRPLLKRVLAPENKTLALPVSAELGAPGGTSLSQFGPDGMTSSLPNLNANYTEEEEPPKPHRDPAWMKNAKSMGEAQANTLRTVGNLVEEHPKQAALIVRDWLGSAA